LHKEIDLPIPFEKGKRIRSWTRRDEGETSVSRIGAEDKKATTHLFVSYCLGF
jgi:hypothetical protein